MQVGPQQYGFLGSSQGFSHGGYSGETYTDGPMTKRRRLLNDNGDESSAGEAAEMAVDWADEQQPSTQQYSAPAFSGAVIGAEYTSSTAHSVTRDGAQSAPDNQWSSGTSPYPDVSSYQQPYFFQQTDPSIYTSPWPPTSAATVEASTFGPPAGTWPNQVNGSAGTMPFFPLASNQVEQSEGFDASAAAASFPSFGQDLEPTSQYSYPQARGESVGQQTSGFYFEDASMQLKIQSLSILDNLATQLIHTIAKASYPQVQDLMKGNDSEESQAYVTLKDLFDKTRRVYSRETPFIDAIAIQMFQPSQQEIIRKANIATFISSILGAHDVSFFHLNEFFMETFVPLGHRLLKWQGAIYLELKTQTYISALMNSDGSPEAMLDELFPLDLDAQILTRHPDAPSLSPSEQDFIDRSRARKSYLLAEPSTEEAVKELPKKYQWHDFVREFASCINKNVDGIMNVPARAQPAFGGTNADRRSANAAQSAHDSLVGQQAIMARNGQTGAAVINGALTSGLMPNIPALPQQNASTEKRSGAPSSTVRQPWTKPEEDALLAGLERVNGPHWSQILALYGRGGSVSEVLKDRNQVQLKDKARNLKLQYLKVGKDVPVALRGVTGELRKRGGARARAALGLMEEDQDGGADAEGEEVDGENIDPTLEPQQNGRSNRRRKSGRRSGPG